MGILIFLFGLLWKLMVIPFFGTVKLLLFRHHLKARWNSRHLTSMVVPREYSHVNSCSLKVSTVCRQTLHCLWLHSPKRETVLICILALTGKMMPVMWKVVFSLLKILITLDTINGQYLCVKAMTGDGVKISLSNKVLFTILNSIAKSN